MRGWDKLGRMGPAARLLASALLGGALLAAAACSGGGAPGPPRVIVLGLDGLDPAAVNELVAEGKLPNLARLAREGATGPLRSSPPLLSPIIWTTAATGRDPVDHGISHFTAHDPRTGETYPATSRMRRTRALWNIASEAGLPVSVVGWWATWPAESVNGTVVSDRVSYHALSTTPPGARAGARADTDADVMFPSSRWGEIAPLVRAPSSVTAADLAPFARVTPDEVTPEVRFDDALGQLRWAIASATTNRDVALYLWKKDAPALQVAYIEATDTVSHLYGHLHRAPPLAGRLAGQQQRFGGAVESIYRWADEAVGRFAAAMDANTTLVILSDHGFRLGELPDDPRRALDPRHATEASHRELGVLILFGRGVRTGTRLRGAQVIDVAPTVLTLLGLPAADDMPGRVLAEALDGAPRARVATYETGPGRQAAPHAPLDATDEALLERLEGLGYIDRRSTAGERIRAGQLLEAGAPEQAEAALRDLVARRPDDAGLRADWGAALGALGRLDEAERELRAALAAAPADASAHHNLGVVLALLSRHEEARAEWSRALDCDPRFGPAEAALARSVPGGTHEPGIVSPATVLAGRLAERAADAARRGDYAGADRLLDDAARLAPDLPIVHHHRANVAVLRGDRAAAVAALERALALDPDDPLLRENLRRLRAAEAVKSPGVR